ncbi:VQ motif-containing protein 9-like [Zingiber officinale]|uniref:VQ motif-containing protein 9-like n=1 Tax=Zingiber officinale TaxID=94328 RepID=UPI001C4DB4B8|nr:VQ motif-containing protein 9-like [Zingiber officinale]
MATRGLVAVFPPAFPFPGHIATEQSPFISHGTTKSRSRRNRELKRRRKQMDSSSGKSNSNPYLAVNRLGKIIQKHSFSSSSSSSSSFLPTPPPPPPQQQQQRVYTISKRDFRSVVQQLTAASTPSHPPSSPPRLHKIRPAPLPLASPTPRLPSPPPPPLSSAPAESPVSAYMRFLLASDDGNNPSPRLPFPSPQPPPSPSAFLDLLSPKSPCSLLSPPLLHYAPPLSPGFSWPPSPSAFPPIPSPTWRNLM